MTEDDPSSFENQPGKPHDGALLDDAALDALLAAARWPAMPAEAMTRLDVRAAELAAPPRRPLRLRAAAWAVIGIAAAMAVAATVWLSMQQDKASPRLIAEVDEPRVAPPVKPAENVPVLPGRAPTQLELAWVVAIRQPSRPAGAQQATSTNPSPAPGSRDWPERVRGPSAPPAVAAAPQVDPQQRLRDLLAVLEDDAGDDTARRAAAVQIPAAVLHRRILEPDAAPQRPVLLWALAQNPDPDAPGVLLDVASEHPEQVRRAVASAPQGSPAILRLVAVLGDPRISRRESAADLLSASADPLVYDAIAGRLAEPGVRREALLALLWSRADAAIAHLNQAEAAPPLRTIVQSLRVQGVAPDRGESPQMIIL